MPSRSGHRCRAGFAVLGAVALSALGFAAVPAAPAAAAGTISLPATCASTPSPVVAGVQIADPACVYDPSTNTYGGTYEPLTNAAGRASALYTGILPDGAAYRIEVPPGWNGTLVMFAHGYRGTGNIVYVDEPQLRQYFVDHGYAWAASSYAENGYDVGTGVIDTHDLLAAFPGITTLTPRQVIMSGLSMGGEITAVEIEAYRGQFAGAMPYCGVLGANSLFDYYLGANVTAAALTRTPISYPTSASAGQAYAPAYQSAVESEMPGLGITSHTTRGGQTYFTTDLTPAGQQWADTVEQLSGGTRPGFASAISYWDSFSFAPLTQVPFLFGLYPGLTGGTIGYADGNVAGNEDTVYRFSDRPGHLTPAEEALNASVLRVRPTATPSTNPAATELPDVTGDPGIPVLSLHGIGDLFVPLSMDQRYARLMAAHGEASLFVDRAIREVGHCDYTTSELSSGFEALIRWVDDGVHPAGDDILDPRVVSSPHFGCRFTDPTPGSHPNFSGPACPPPQSHGHGGYR